MRRPSSRASFISPGQVNPHRGFNYLFGDVGQADPFAAQVIFLSHFDTSTQNIALGINADSNLNVAVSLAQQKFGVGSLLCTPVTAGDYLRYPVNSRYLDLNGPSFTIEGFVRPTSFGVQRQILHFWRDFAGGTVFVQISAAGVLSLTWQGTNLSTVAVLTLNDWNYFAFSKPVGVGSTARSYLALGGAATATLRATTAMPSPDPMIAGTGLGLMNEMSLGVGTTRPMAGWIDDLRVTASTTAAANRYTAASFPVPTEAFAYP